MRLRVLIGMFTVSAFMAFVAMPALLSAPFEPTGRFLIWLTRQWGKLLLFFGPIKVVVKGAENIPKGPAVYAVNHQSALDVPLLFAHFPADFRIIHKRSLFWTPVVGQYLYFGRHIGIDRKNAFRAKQSLVKAAARIRAGTSVATFPEGTRSRDGRVQPFKRGTFVLAQDADVPVVPVSLVGVKALVPDGLVSMRAGTVMMIIHPAVVRGERAAEEWAEEVRGVIVRDCEASPS